MSGNLVLAFDVGGSHVAAALVDLTTLSIEAAQSQPLDTRASGEAVMDAFGEIGAGVLAKAPARKSAGIAMAMPGPFDYQNGICYIRGQAKYDQLFGFDFRRGMAARFPDFLPCDIRFVNDASAALLGEIHRGAAAGAGRVIGLTLGTGIGSAFAVDGRIVIAGPGVPPHGYIYCLPWKEGTVEDTLSSRGLQGRYREVSGRLCDAREIAALASTDPLAKKVMEDFGRDLGAVLLPLATSFRPDVIVLGGAIARSAQLFLPAAQEAIEKNGTCLKVFHLLDHAALVGAAVAWQEK
ncbi:MAG: ROK family protein [Acidobacteriia bacterium]|nr:ROK family protein [Terriglobia bacterium]